MSSPISRRLVADIGQRRRHAPQLQIGAYVYPIVPTEFSNWRTSSGLATDRRSI